LIGAVGTVEEAAPERLLQMAKRVVTRHRLPGTTTTASAARTSTGSSDDGALRLQALEAAVTSRYPSAEHAFVPPPAGSNLAPVMGIYDFPFLGHILSSTAEPLDIARRRYAKYGPVSWAGGVGSASLL
jgi:hypothetical protein